MNQKTLDLENQSRKSELYSTVEKGLVCRGTFTASKEELMEMIASDSAVKLHNMAKHILSLPNKQRRRKWLDGYQAKNGVEMTDKLKDKIMKLAGK